MKIMKIRLLKEYSTLLETLRGDEIIILFHYSNFENWLEFKKKTQENEIKTILLKQSLFRIALKNSLDSFFHSTTGIAILKWNNLGKWNEISRLYLNIFSFAALYRNSLTNEINIIKLSSIKTDFNWITEIKNWNGWIKEPIELLNRIQCKLLKLLQNKITN